jgi:two-component system nitrogen regulation sensor histidine kinase NtrY
VTFDDVTDLVSAQRMAAWGDVARRIAHEIKNPLTPIQLSAERMRRKFGPLVGDQADTLEQYTDVIIRQTNDLRRIVDEFSKFARMPEPERRMENLTKLIGDAVLLQQNARQDIDITLKNNRKKLLTELDSTMITQALTNLIKNAGEAIDSYMVEHKGEEFSPEIRVLVDTKNEATVIRIQDNGIGLPKEQRSRLFEPYVTNRESGTGLGLSIVKKIIEEHGGTLELVDAPKFKGNKHVGAMARITLPIMNQEQEEFVKAKVA